MQFNSSSITASFVHRFDKTPQEEVQVTGLVMAAELQYIQDILDITPYSIHQIMSGLDIKPGGHPENLSAVKGCCKRGRCTVIAEMKDSSTTLYISQPQVSYRLLKPEGKTGGRGSKVSAIGFRSIEACRPLHGRGKGHSGHEPP